MVRLGFVGVGMMGQAAHLRNYASLPGCEVVAIAEIRPKLAEEVARRYGVKHVYDGCQAMLGSEKLDAIVAIQQFSMHLGLVPELLRYGAPLMIEKPLADSVESGEKIMSAVTQSGTPLFLAYHKRSDPASVYALDQMRRWRASGEVGALRYIRITMPPGDWIQNGFAFNVKTDETYEQVGTTWDAFGTFVNYYIHQMNLFRYFLEEDYDVVFADPSGVTLTICSASGVAGTLEMAPYHTKVGWQESVLIGFERGYILIDLPAPLVINRSGRVTVYANDSAFSPTLPESHAMWCQAENFLKSVRGETNPLATAEDALKDLLVSRQYISLKEAAR